MQFTSKDTEPCCLIVKNKEQTEDNQHGCCTPQPKGKVECPKCGKKAKGVLGKTIQHLLTNKAKSNIALYDGFYYCKTSTCRVIYFRGDEILTQEDLSVKVGLKDGTTPANLCYCFGWTKERIEDEIFKNGKSGAIDDIKHKMATVGCSCEIKNPSGNCCMGDVSKYIKDNLT